MNVLRCGIVVYCCPLFVIKIASESFAAIVGYYVTPSRFEFVS